MKILLVEDDPDIQATLARHLENAGFLVERCADGAQAIELGLAYEYHAVILDPGLPIFSGEQVIKRWRKEGRKFPIIIVTGTRITRDEKIELIDLGVAMHVSKPVLDYDVLVAWVRSYCNSSSGIPSGSTVKYQEIELDTSTSSARFRGRLVRLSKNEFSVLKELALSGDTPLPARAIAARCFGDSEGLKEMDVRTYISRINDDKIKTKVIHNFNKGYVISC